MSPNTETRARWDQPCEDRGWLLPAGWTPGTSTLGNYLDYGPDHYRSGHEYCQPGICTCRLSQPGNVHAVFYAAALLHQQGPHPSRYCRTIFDAIMWIEAKAREAATRVSPS